MGIMALMKMCIMLCKGDWWGISMSLMKGGLRTWISNGSHGGKGHLFGAKFFFCLLTGVFCSRVY